MIKKYYLLLCLSLLTVFACDDEFEGKTYMEGITSDEPVLNNGEWLTAHADRFSLWVELLKRADQYNAIADGSSAFTLFVPDNTAVQRFLDLRGVGSVSELDPDYARDVVQLHMIEMKISKAVFLVGGRLSRTSTFGTYLTVSFAEDAENATGSGIWVNDAAEVIDVAEPTTNGVIYTLNNVLIPVTETVYDQISLNTDYSIFKEALDLTGWGQRLDRTTDTVTSETGLKETVKLKFTCFVVPNEAFTTEGISSAQDLAQKLGAGGNYTDTTNALYQYVGYHVINKSYYEEALYPFPAETTDTAILWTPQATNQMFTTNLAVGEKYINYAADTRVQITQADIEARNGVLHEVSGYMPVYIPEPLRVLWDLCDYPDVESVVNARGESNNLGNCYGVFQPQGDVQIPLYTSAAITSYDFNYYNSSSRSNWDVVGYYLNSLKMDSIHGGGYLYQKTHTYPNNYDLLCLNLGYMGWISMQTPTILKGKYKVAIHYFYIWDYMADLTEGGSLATLTFDNDEKLSYQASFYKGILANSGLSNGLYSITMFDELEFTETTTHQFKVVLQDPRASSHKTYALLLDYVEFIPITD